MNEIQAANWADFLDNLDAEYQCMNKAMANRKGFPFDLLFRGHSSCGWELQSTLERYFKINFGIYQEVSWFDYNDLLSAIEPTIFAMVGEIYKMEFIGDRTSMENWPYPPNYALMVYLRHHGFPSPLLDWTTSPYIAAFFAFYDAIPGQNVAIFSFSEHLARRATTDGEKQVTPLARLIHDAPCQGLADVA
jgi:hypothetical protein